jgi:SAM-dependent methyltransferase
MNQWYEELFQNYGKKYDKEIFTKGTIGECDFIEKEIKYNKQVKILDIGCGTGRHSIELAKRGYAVTGIDLSESLLCRAKDTASKEGLKIDEMNFQILQGATRALKVHGKLIFTTLNGLFPLFHSVKDFLETHNESGNAKYGNDSFDLMTFRNYSSIDFEDDSGNKKNLKCNERYYVPSEITWLLKTLNYKIINIFGAKLGTFSRNDKLTTDDLEMLVLAEK